MQRSLLARACVPVVVVAVLIGACGSDDDTDVASTSTTTTAPPGTGPTTSVEPSTSSTTPANRVIELAFTGGQVSGGVRTEKVALGETVVLRVTSDVSEEVHVHTYDVVAPVGPGAPAELEVEATIPGRHEVELEERGRQLVVLEVS